MSGIIIHLMLHTGTIEHQISGDHGIPAVGDNISVKVGHGYKSYKVKFRRWIYCGDFPPIINLGVTPEATR